MPMQRFAVATLAGGVTMFVLGFLIYGVAFASFFATNTGSATGIAREPLALWALALGQLVFGAFLTIVLGWARVSSAGGGLRAGAIVGLLAVLGVDLTMYGTTNIANMTATLVDPILAMIQMGSAGAVIGALLGKTRPM